MQFRERCPACRPRHTDAGVVSLRHPSGMRDFPMPDRSDLHGIQRRNRDSFSVQRLKLHLVRRSVTVDMHDCTYIASHEFLVGQVNSKNDSLMFSYGGHDAGPTQDTR